MGFFYLNPSPYAQGAGLTPMLKSLDVPPNLDFTPDTVASGKRNMAVSSHNLPWLHLLNSPQACPTSRGKEGYSREAQYPVEIAEVFDEALSANLEGRCPGVGELALLANNARI